MIAYDKILIFWVCVIALFQSGTDTFADNPYPSRKIALVIGNQSYESSPLLNPANDAGDMGKALSDLGFEVTVKIDLDWKGMHETIQEFGNQLAKGGIGFFYYAGHGMQVSGKNYLIPVGSNIRFEKEVKYKSIDADLILAEMENARNRMNIIVLDACRGNPFIRSFRTIQEGLTYMSAPAGTIIAYSTGPGKKASDGTDGNGLYTHELVKQMRIPGLRLIDIFNNVRKIIRTKTGGLQIPWESTSLEGAFYFIPPESAALADTKAIETKVTETKNKIVQAEPEEKTWTEPVTGIEFVWVSGGCFQMGCGSWTYDCEEDEEPVHEVCVDGFWIGKHEITNRQFAIFLNDFKGKIPQNERWINTSDINTRYGIIHRNGSYSADENSEALPVTNVSWYGAVAFTEWLKGKQGYAFDLPTEAEWEFAARNGGEPIVFAGGDAPMPFGWYQENSSGTIHPVGNKLPNRLGIFDMSGNVWEWCKDIYQETGYLGHSKNNPVNVIPDGAARKAALRVIRGGSYLYGSDRSRCSNRGSHWVAGQNEDLGFRVVIHPESTTPTREYTCFRTCGKSISRKKM